MEEIENEPHGWRIDPSRLGSERLGVAIRFIS
jgi:hypothetical protein